MSYSFVIALRNTKDVTIPYKGIPNVFKPGKK